MNEGPYRIALRGGNGGYSVVREPSTAQRVAAELRGESPPTSESFMRGPLTWADAKRTADGYNAQLEPNL